MSSWPKLEGLVAATHTPFGPDGSLNLKAVPRQAEHLIAHGITAAFITGTTGESHSLSMAERQSLTRRWAEVLSGSTMKLVVHVGHNALPEAKALASEAQRAGAHAIAAMAPSYYKPPDLESLVAFCRELAAAAPELPFYFYDIPSWTGVCFSMPEFLELVSARIPTLAGLKFTNTDLMQFQQCLRVADGAYDILFGCDENLLAALALGGRGAVGSTYNFAAPIYHRLLKAFAAGDLATARTEQHRSVRLIQVLSSYGYLAASKWLMTRLGVPVGTVRLPLRPLPPGQEEHLEQALASLGFFDWIQP